MHIQPIGKINVIICDKEWLIKHLLSPYPMLVPFDIPKFRATIPNGTPHEYNTYRVNRLFDSDLSTIGFKSVNR